eukprot:TRINITY_DN30993_c0_g1_i1.p1 TRINITY_DN30993_c0_g1~~TRINITY_DN30993_c0_g1_i1.p1  ORF type:complete len:679 (+),score=112.32 TRINITY_DN30993_c0_g1_i1:69-2105(+)
MEEISLWDCVVTSSKEAKAVKNILEGKKLIDKAVQLVEKPSGGVAFPLVKGKEAETKALEGVVIQQLRVKVKQRPVPPPQPIASQAPVYNELPGDSFFGVDEIEKITLSSEPETACLQLEKIVKKGVPVLMENLPVGSCLEKWTVDFLKGIDRTVNAQVCRGEKVDLAGHRTKNTKGNFTFHPMKFSELVERCSNPGSVPFLHQPDERYYLRSVVEGRMTKPSHFPDIFPEIGDDFDISALARLMEPTCGYHSSALRVTAPCTQLWTHYDTLPNLLTQVLGEKTCTLHPPACDGDLYVEGTSSRVNDLVDPSPELYPNAVKAQSHALTIKLCKGQTLFIPPLWFHHTMSAEGISVAVNVFFERKTVKKFYQPKDLYGNKDLPLGLKLVEKGEKLISDMESLPQPYKAFYARKLIQVIEKKTFCVHRERYAGEKKVAVVTGGTGVIGKEIVKGLLAKNMHVVVISRRAEAEVEQGAVVRVADLSNMGSIEACVENLLYEFNGNIEVLVNNAAVVGKEKIMTGEGLELQFAVNVASYYKFIRGLSKGNVKNIVNVASNWAGGHDPNDPFFATRKYTPSAAYRASKQANRILTHALAPLLTPTIINACHPGVVCDTAVSNSLNLKSGSHTPAEAAAVPLYLATSPPSFTGKYLAGGIDVPPVEDLEWTDLEQPLLDLLEGY